MTEITTEQLNELLQKAKTHKKAFNNLKNVAVAVQDFNLAVTLREMEKELFPEPPEVTAAKKFASQMKTLLAMVDLNATDEISWVIGNLFQQYKVKKGGFSLKDASTILVKRDELFPKGKETE